MDLWRIIMNNPLYVTTQIISLSEQAQSSRSQFHFLQKFRAKIRAKFRAKFRIKITKFLDFISSHNCTLLPRIEIYRWLIVYDSLKWCHTYSYLRWQPACEGRHLVATVLYLPVASFFIWVFVPVISLHQFPSTSFDFLKYFRLHPVHFRFDVI